MKYVMAMKYRGALGWGGEGCMRHMKLFLAKDGSLLRGEVGLVRAGLVVCGDWSCWDRVCA